ncbi:MAG TPA: glycosyltransferase [Candidatus Limnocylindrales bacterium]|nr:glycosyltransferase [Candidatus Limnocylindrales bacterium]
MQPESPSVSFIVPCYNMAGPMSECVCSILKQTYQDFEILIMDNCSPDNTPEVARSFSDPRVRYIRNETNLGHVRNFNKGVTLARGKYVWMIAADDSLRSSHVVERFVGLMERNPSVGYVFCRAIEVQNGKEAGIVQWADCGDENCIWDGHRFLARLIRNNCIVMSSGMVRKECFDKAGLYPLDMPHACDWYLWCSFALFYNVAYFSEPMVYFRVHEGSLTSSFNREDATICLMDELRVLSRVRDHARFAGVRTLLEASRVSIATRAARALNAGSPRRGGPSISEGELQTLFQRQVSNPRDETGLWARIFIALGDEQYSAGESNLAKRSYLRGLGLRPWWPLSWAKYLLLVTGRVGRGIRTRLTVIAVGVRLKQ